MASGPRARQLTFPSDDVVIERAPDGRWRYFRADDPAHEEYTYRHPFILELEITRRCNLRCVHCYAEASGGPFEDEMSLDEIRGMLGDARSIGIRELSLTGGEVLLRPDFLAIVDAAVDLGYAVRFVTNGTLLDDRMLAALCERAIKLVTVSLDAVSPGPHERLRGGGSHAPTLAAIDRLVEAGFRLSVITAFSRLNIEDFDALLGFCVRRRVDWQVQMTTAKGRCPGGVTFSPDEYYALGEKVAEAFSAKLPINVVPMDDLATFSHFRPLDALSGTWQRRCTGGLLNLFVRAGGDVTPCSALAFPECVVGNVRREPLSRICGEERCRRNLEWLHPGALEGICGECPFRHECSGGCPDVLISMCRSRTENEYCYHRIEQRRILDGAFGDA